MRQNRIGWLTAVVLASLVGAGSIRAAAHPGKVVVKEVPEVSQDQAVAAQIPECKEGFAVGGSVSEGPVDPVEALMPQIEGFVKLPKAPGCPAALPIPSPSTTREYTIVVHIDDRSSADSFYYGPLNPWFRSPFPPSHAVSREYWNFFDREQEASAVLESLQKKLLELHEKGCFEVEFAPNQGDRSEMRIRYNPVIFECVEPGTGICISF
jgi:hypothetical protein